MCILTLWTMLLVVCFTQGQKRCNEDQRLCLSNNELHCVPLTYLCDGIQDCDDRSDETELACEFKPCRDFGVDKQDSDDYIQLVNQRSFTCDYGACISYAFICDGFPNCVDNSDETEKLCSGKICKGDQFACGYGACIPVIYACNGINNCYDGSDETMELCQEFRPCTVYEFKCDYGACIRKNKVCNGMGNCRDNSDESEEMCGASHTFTAHAHTFGIETTTSAPLSTVPPPLNNTTPAKEPETGCLRASPSGGRFELLNCGGDDCFGVTEFPYNTVILARCSDGPRRLICENDNRWHDIEDMFSPAKFVCETKVSINGANSECTYAELEGKQIQILNCEESNNPFECKNDSATPGTLISSTCIGAKRQILECFDDGKWHVLGDTGFYSEGLCVPVSKDSPASCGHPTSLHGEADGFRYPFLVGLFSGDNYICTGTFISSSHIVTGAHCVVSNQGGTTDSVSPHTLRVQHSQNGKIIKSLVSSIHIHPQYVGGARLRFDIAIIKLTRPSIIPGEFEPACLYEEEVLFNKEATVFNRTIGQNAYSWSLFTLKLDVGCFNRETPCTRALDITDDQFCGSNPESPLYLHQGSSGGPYMLLEGTSEKKWHIAGIVSRAVTTNDPEYPCSKPHTVFTSIPRVHEWLKRCLVGNCE